MSNKKIKIIAEIINSKPDQNGNRYFSAIITDPDTSKIAKGIVAGGENNITSALWEYCGYESQYYYTRTELPIREYQRLTKNWPYLGCTNDEIISNVLKQWGKES